MTAGTPSTLNRAAEVILGRQRSPQHDLGPHMVPYLRAANVQDGFLDLTDVKRMNFTPSEQKIFALRSGDVLVTEGSGSIGAVGASAVWNSEHSGTTCFQNTLLRLRPRDGVDGRYLAWWARAAHASGMFASIAGGANIYHLSAERVRALPIVLPIPQQQQRIADFLDNRIVQIGELSLLLDQQIGGLEDRKAAIIETELRSVDFGYRRLKYLATIVDTEHRTAPQVEGGGYWIAGTSSVRNGSLIRDALYETSIQVYHEWTRRKVPAAGDILLSREAPVGEVAMYMAADPPIAIGQRMVLISPNKHSIGRYLMWSLLSAAAKDFISLATQGSLHPHLNMSDIGGIPVRWVPTDLQVSIAEEIDAKVGHIEATIAIRRRQLATLAERRQALIMAAVTGRLDVTTGQWADLS